jgi:AraC family transcriptional regulator
MEAVMRIENRERWLARMERALALLADRLDDPPSLHALADAAGCSPWHFHRIWRALAGEAVSATIARLRIAAGQQRLRDDPSVTHAAIDGGFGTPQSFARAFRRVAGLSPSDFLASGGAATGVAAPLAEVRIELYPERTLVALHREGGAYRELNALFQAVWDWAEASGAIAGLRGIYGIPWDDPLSVPEAALRYDAALALDAAPPPPFHRIALPAGPHAVLRHTGSYDALEASNEALICWMLASGGVPLDLPLHHHFLDDPETVPEAALRTDILLALAPEGDR